MSDIEGKKPPNAFKICKKIKNLVFWLLNIQDMENHQEFSQGAISVNGLMILKKS